jgi:hypothetical protein
MRARRIDFAEEDSKALLVIENLLRAGLARVDDGLTLEMVRVNML